MAAMASALRVLTTAPQTTRRTHADESDALDELQRQCVRELTTLRDQLEESEQVNKLLKRKLKVLTNHLTETTQELAHRMTLYTEATERAEKLELQMADAKKAVLTREMQIHDLSQQVKTLTMTVQKEEQAKDHWERKFIAAKDEVTRVTRISNQKNEKLDDKVAEVAAWKSKLQVAMKTLEDHKEELEAKRTREVQLLDTVAKAKATAHEYEKRWKAKMQKRDKAIIGLEQQLASLRDSQQQVEERSREMTDNEAQWRSCEAAQQLEKRRQLLALQTHLQHATGEVEKAKMNEMLMQRELCRLREELLLSESQRKTEQRRHEQQTRGKDKEMAFIWQKYVEAVASRGSTGPPSYFHGMMRPQ